MLHYSLVSPRTGETCRKPAVKRAEEERAQAKKRAVEAKAREEEERAVTKKPAVMPLAQSKGRRAPGRTARGKAIFGARPVLPVLYLLASPALPFGR